MTLLEQLQNIKARLNSSLNDIILALEEKGVVAPNDLIISGVADQIRAIFQSDFEFIFNFREIDQFGNPHTPNIGQETGGNTGINPTMFDIAITPISFRDDNVINVVPEIHGTFGLCVGSDVNFDLQHNIPSIVVMEDFNETILPEILNYDPSLETA